MKQKVSLLLVGVMLAALLGAVPALAADRQYLWKQSFDGLEVKRYANATDSEYHPEVASGGSYGIIDIKQAPEGAPVSGNYMEYSCPSVPWQQFVGFYGEGETGSTADYTGVGHKQDFVLHSKIAPTGQSVDFTLFYESSWGAVQDGNHSIMRMAAGGALKVLQNGALTEVDYTTKSQTWYDVLVYVAWNEGNPTYTVYIKELAQSGKYTCAANSLPLPTGDYSGGVKCFAYLYNTTGTYAGFWLDDLELFYPETGFSVDTGDDEKYVSNSIQIGEGGKATLNGKEYTGTAALEGLEEGGELSYTVTPNQGKKIDSITYNGVALPNASGTVQIVGGAAFTVTFRDDPATAAPSVTTNTTVVRGTADGYPAFTVYATATGYQKMDGFGAELKRNADGATLLLEGKAEVIPLFREAEGKFAIRVFGEALSGTPCTLTPYISVEGVKSQGEQSESFEG